MNWLHICRFPVRLPFFQIAAEFPQSPEIIFLLSQAGLDPKTAIRGFVGKQNTTILLSDFKGFLNFLIVFPMMAVMYKKNRVISFLKMLCLSLGVVSVLGIILAFYLQMPLEIRHWAYDFFDGYNICMIHSRLRPATIRSSEPGFA